MIGGLFQIPLSIILFSYEMYLVARLVHQDERGAHFQRRFRACITSLATYVFFAAFFHTLFYFSLRVEPESEWKYNALVQASMMQLVPVSISIHCCFITIRSLKFHPPDETSIQSARVMLADLKGKPPVSHIKDMPTIRISNT